MSEARRGRVGDFSVEVENIVRKSQHQRCYWLEERGIEVFHHEPARWELIMRGLWPGEAQYAVGVCLPAHEAIHQIRYSLFGLEGDRNAYRGIREQLDEEEKELCENLLQNGELKERIEEFILRRREGYFDVRIRG